MKVCCRCEIKKPISEFHNKTSSKDGLDNRCKDCKRNYNKMWLNDNRDHVREYNRKFVKNQRKDPVKRMYKNLMSRASKFKKRKGLEVNKSYKEIIENRLISIDASLLNSKLKNLHRRCCAPIDDKKQFQLAILSKKEDK